MIIELDGGQHLNSENDQLRDRFFENQGFKVIRIWNNQTDQNLDDTLKYIYTECEILKNNHPHLTSPIQGEEE